MLSSLCLLKHQRYEEISSVWVFFLLQGILAGQLGFSSVLFILIPYSLKIKGILVNLLFPEHCGKQKTDIIAISTKASYSNGFQHRNLNFHELTYSSNNLKKPGPCSLIYRNSTWTCICICKNVKNLFTHGFSVRHKVHLSETRFHLIVWIHELNGSLKHLKKQMSRLNFKEGVSDLIQISSFHLVLLTLILKKDIQDSWCAVYVCISWNVSLLSLYRETSVLQATQKKS